MARKPPPSTETADYLTSTLAAAREDALMATAAVNVADAAYRAALIDQPPAAVRSLIDARTEATIAADRAAAIIANLEGRIAAAEIVEVEGVRRARYDAAVKLAAKASDELAKYPAAAEAIRTVLGAIAEADVAIAAANVDLPAGKAPIVYPETMRSLPNLPEEGLSEEIVELWAHDGDSTPLPDSQQGRVDHRGRIRVDDNAYDFPCVKRTYNRRTFLPAVVGRHARPLASEIRLPGAFGESSFWEPAHDSADALRQLGKHRRPPAVDGPREPVTTLVPMGRS